MSPGKTEELQVQIQYALMEKLSKSQRRQAKLLELVDHCIFECDGDLRLTYVNAAWQRKLGYSDSELLGSSLSDLLTPGDLEDSTGPVDTIRQAARSSGVELQLLDSQGGSCWFEIRMTANDESGYIGSLFDIQQHKDMESRLRGQEEESRRLSFVASHTNNMVIITDREGRIEWVNESFEKRVGYQRSEVLGRRPGEFLQGPETDPEVVAEMSLAVSKAQPFKVEIVNYDRAANPYWISIDASPVIDDDGAVSHFIAVEEDITQRVKAEKTVAQSEYNYRSVMNNIHEVVIRLCPDAKIQFVNQAWSEAFGGLAPDCIGSGMHDFLAPEHRSDFVATINEFHSGRRAACRLDVQIIRADGNWAWAEMTMAPIYDVDKKSLASIAATLMDIDERVAVATALEQAKRDAELLAQAKSRFLANISHEIRTPLNAVLGSADILQDTGLTREQQTYTRMIHTSGSALISILDDVLTHSRFEAGGITLEEERFDLASCLEEAVDIVSTDAVGKGLLLIVDLGADVPTDVVGDKSRLRQVLINLLSNGIKFTARGEVVLRVRGQQHVGNGVDIEVIDTGIGIVMERQAQMFEPFMQSDVSTTRQFGGSGLGLAICRQICEAAGGTISVTSEPGNGSVFKVQYPLQCVGESPEKFKDRRNRSIETTIALVGPASALTRAIEQSFKRQNLSYIYHDNADRLPVGDPWQFALLVATDTQAAQGCRKYLGLRQGAVGNDCALVVLELLMQGRLVERLPGNEVQLNGPFKPSHIQYALENLELVESAIGESKSSFDVSDDVPQPDDRHLGRVVLVVEDNPQNQIIAQQFLQRFGCEVLLADHGAEALKILRKQRVDLVLMDIQMPVMDGLTTTAHIRGSGALFSRVPIIAVTADVLHGDRERYLSADMDGYLPKPLSRVDLRNQLDKYFPLALPRVASRSSDKRDRLCAAWKQLASI